MISLRPASWQYAFAELGVLESPTSTQAGGRLQVADAWQAASTGASDRGKESF